MSDVWDLAALVVAALLVLYLLISLLTPERF